MPTSSIREALLYLQEKEEEKKKAAAEDVKILGDVKEGAGLLKTLASKSITDLIPGGEEKSLLETLQEGGKERDPETGLLREKEKDEPSITASLSYLDNIKKTENQKELEEKSLRRTIEAVEKPAPAEVRFEADFGRFTEGATDEIISKIEESQKLLKRGNRTAGVFREEEALVLIAKERELTSGRATEEDGLTPEDRQRSKRRLNEALKDITVPGNPLTETIGTFSAPYAKYQGKPSDEFAINNLQLISPDDSPEEQARKQRENEEAIDDDTRGIGEMIGRILTTRAGVQKMPWSPAGWMETLAYTTAANRLKRNDYYRFDNGEQLRAQDVWVIEQSHLKIEEAIARPLSLGGVVVEGVTMLPGYMLEFWAGGSGARFLSLSGKRVASGLLKKVGKSSILKAGIKTTGRLLDPVLRGIAQLPSAIPRHGAEFFAEAKAPKNVRFVDGRLESDPGASTPQALAEAILRTGIMTVAESSGSLLGQGGKSAKIFAKRFPAFKIKANKLSSLLKTRWLKTHKSLKNFSVGNFGEEFGEEKLEDAMNIAFGVTPIKDTEGRIKHTTFFGRILPAFKELYTLDKDDFATGLVLIVPQLGGKVAGGLRSRIVTQARKKRLLTDDQAVEDFAGIKPKVSDTLLALERTPTRKDFEKAGLKGFSVEEREDFVVRLSEARNRLLELSEKEVKQPEEVTPPPLPEAAPGGVETPVIDAEVVSEVQAPEEAPTSKKEPEVVILTEEEKPLFEEARIDLRQVLEEDVGEEIEVAPAEGEKAKKLRLPFSEKTEAQARKEFREDIGNLQAGIPLTFRMIKNLTIIGTNTTVRGINTFSEWSAEMVKQLGTQIEPHLRKIWQESQNFNKLSTEKQEVQRKAFKKDVGKVAKLAEATETEQFKFILGEHIKAAKTAVRETKRVVRDERLNIQKELATRAKKALSQKDHAALARHLNALIRTKALTPKALKKIEQRLEKEVLKSEHKAALKIIVKDIAKIKKTKHLGKADKEALDALLEPFTENMPLEKTFERMQKLIDAVDSDELSQIPKAAMDKAQSIVDKKEKLLIRELTTDEITELSNSIRKLLGINLLKQQLRLRDKLRQRKKSIDSGVGNVKEFHKKVRKEGGEALDEESQLKKFMKLPIRVLGKDQLSYETHVYKLVGDKDDPGAIIDKDTGENLAYKTLQIDIAEAEENNAKILQNSTEHKVKMLTNLGLMDDTEAGQTGEKTFEWSAEKVRVRFSDRKLNGRGSITITNGELAAFTQQMKDPEARAFVLRGKNDVIFTSHDSEQGFRLNATDIVNIEALAGKRRLAKEMADELFKYENTVVRDYQNAESIKRWGYEIAFKDNYAHMDVKTEGDSVSGLLRKTDLTRQDLYIERKPGSRGSLVISDALKAHVALVNKTAAFATKSEVIENARALLNNKDFRIAVDSRIRDGKHVLRQMNKLIDMFEGLTVRDFSSLEGTYAQIIKWLKGKFLFARPHIMAVQGTSVINAAALFEDGTALLAKHADAAFTDAKDAEMEEDSGILYQRFHGSPIQIFSPGQMSQDALRQALGFKETLSNRVGFGGIKKFDTGAIRVIRAMAMDEQAQKGFTGMELRKQAAVRTVEVITKTQPTWRSMTLSFLQAAGRESAIAQLATMFSSQRTKNRSATERAVVKYSRSKKTAADKKTFAKEILYPGIISPILYAAVNTSFRILIYGNIARVIGRLIFPGSEEDDQKERGFFETAIGAIFGNWLIGGDAALFLARMGKSKITGKGFSVKRNLPSNNVVVGELIGGLTVIGEVIDFFITAATGEEIKGGSQTGRKKWKNHLSRAVQQGLQRSKFTSAIGFTLKRAFPHRRLSATESARKQTNLKTKISGLTSKINILKDLMNDTDRSAESRKKFTQQRNRLIKERNKAEEKVL